MARHNGVKDETKRVSDVKARRQRSISVVRQRHSQNDADFFCSPVIQENSRGNGNGDIQRHSFCKPTTSSLLRKSASQRDLCRYQDNYSSHSSSLTDDEAMDVYHTRSGAERTIQTVYSKKAEHPISGDDGLELFEVMRKEMRNAVEEIRTELGKVIVNSEPMHIVGGESGDNNQLKGSDVMQIISDIRKSCTTKLEQSEKRRQDLLAELAVEEQHGQELTKIVREFLPVIKQTTSPKKHIRSRRKSNEKNRMLKYLTEDAEKYFEDFLSNVEDTEISSYDGERSDNSSTLGGSTKHKNSVYAVVGTQENSMKGGDSFSETDGLLLPWLQWETSNDLTPELCKDSKGPFAIPAKNMVSLAKEACTGNECSASSHGSWSPESRTCYSSNKITEENKSAGEAIIGSALSDTPRGASFNMEEYEHLKHSSDLQAEMWRQRFRIESGSLFLCGRSCI